MVIAIIESHRLPIKVDTFEIIDFLPMTHKTLIDIPAIIELVI